MIFRLILFLFPITTAYKIAADDETALNNPIYEITIDTSITHHAAEYIKNAINNAAKNKAQALIIHLDTPGGLIDATRDIVQNILTSPIPIIVYISPDGARAGSAGLFISLAAHVLAMAPSTNMGAAHPVSLFGQDIGGEMNQKVTNDAASWARSIAETRKRNAAWAEQAVRKSKAISAQGALKIGVIDFIATNDKELLSKLNLKKIVAADKTITLHTENKKIISFSPNARQKLMDFFSNPNLIYILLLLGILGIFIEFQAPGLIIPGLIGGICLAIVFGVQVLPINWFGAILIFLALGFFIAEIFIVSMGLLALAGLISLIIGSYLLFSVPGSSIFIDPLVIFIFSATLALFMIVIGYLILRAKRQGPTANVDAIVGTTGKVVKDITPQELGTIFIQGSYWRAKSDEHIEKHAIVKVIKVESTVLVVKKIKEHKNAD